MPTGDLRRDGRGRHTTRHRQLLVLPGGALLVDTPDCASCRSGKAMSTAHSRTSPSSRRSAASTTARTSSEPGCAVQDALESGVPDPERYKSYRKLERELRAIELRSSSRLRREAKQRWRQRTRESRAARRYGKRP